MPLIHAELSERIIGCCIRGQKALGPGFFEKIKKEARCLELTKAGLDDERQKSVPVLHEGKQAGEHRPDRVIATRVVVELKATADMEDVHLATARSYLKASSLRSPASLILPGSRSTSSGSS